MICRHCDNEAEFNDVMCEHGFGLPHCEECVAECDYCHKQFCKDFLKDWDGVLVCEECQMEKLVSHVRNNFALPGYWYSGLTRIDGKVTLEFISSGGPKIEVSFNRN